MKLAFLLATVATVSTAQAPVEPMRTGTFTSFLGPGPAGLPGRPYSAEQLSEHSQTLADGTHISQQTQKSLMYRDSAGRTRSEQSFVPPAGAVSGAPMFVQINDPVAGVHYFLNVRNHEATRLAMPSAMGGTQASRAVVSPQAGFVGAIQLLPPPAAGTTASSPGPKTSRESLGTQTIEGISAEGSRITRTYPEGSFGNDRPVTVVTEIWTSTDLKIALLTKTSDPRSGDTTMRITSISLDEPDPALFQVPADYTIVDQQPPTHH